MQSGSSSNLPTNILIVIISKVSSISGVRHEFDLPVTQAQLDQFAAGKHTVQDVFPTLTADQREFLISGCTPTEWDALFAGWDEDDQ